MVTLSGACRNVLGGRHSPTRRGGPLALGPVGPHPGRMAWFVPHPGRDLPSHWWTTSPWRQRCRPVWDPADGKTNDCRRTMEKQSQTPPAAVGAPHVCPPLPSAHAEVFTHGLRMPLMECGTPRVLSDVFFIVAHLTYKEPHVTNVHTS